MDWWRRSSVPPLARALIILLAAVLIGVAVVATGLDGIWLANPYLPR